MELKHELNPTPSNEQSKETKNQQVLNSLIGNKLVDRFGNYNEDINIKFLYELTEEDFNKAHNTVALCSPANFSLFKPNFKMDLLNKLFTAVAMGEQYAFSTQVLTQEPSEIDKREVMEKRKILFISKNNTVQIYYCSDDWDYVCTEVTDENLKNILRKYKEGLPLNNEKDLTKINAILTKLGIRTQQDKAERLLKTSPELMLEKISFTDCSGRTFSNISVFEYILWALDTRYMFNMMLNCLPQNEKGLELAQKLQAQYDHHKVHGVTYTLKGQPEPIKEYHFDFSVLIQALQDYVDNFDKWNWEQREAHWCNVVGMALCYVPAHIMQHYCDPNVPFYPLPKFEAEQFIRTLKFYNYDKGSWMDWVGVTTGCSDSVLGDHFGISGGRHANAKWSGALAGASGCGGRGDLAALKAVCEVRAADYVAIPSKLTSFEKKVSMMRALTMAWDHKSSL